MNNNYDVTIMHDVTIHCTVANECCESMQDTLETHITVYTKE